MFILFFLMLFLLVLFILVIFIFFFDFFYLLLFLDTFIRFLFIIILFFVFIFFVFKRFWVYLLDCLFVIFLVLKLLGCIIIDLEGWIWYFKIIFFFLEFGMVLLLCFFFSNCFWVLFKIFLKVGFGVV